MNKLPSISELQYRNHNLFAGIIAFAVILSLIGAGFIPAVLFAGVYVFRNFHDENERPFHYAFAVGAFIALAYELHFFAPIGMALIGAGITKWRGCNNYIFIFELIAGISYIIKIILNFI